MKPREIEIEETIQEVLVGRNLYPFSIFYTFLGDSDNFSGTLGISFYTRIDLEELLDILDYKSLCDKNGFIILEDSNTVIITRGESIMQLWSKL